MADDRGDVMAGGGASRGPITLGGLCSGDKLVSSTLNILCGASIRLYLSSVFFSSSK